MCIILASTITCPLDLFSFLLQEMHWLGLRKNSVLNSLHCVALSFLTNVLQSSHKMCMCFISLTSCLKLLGLLYSMCILPSLLTQEVQAPWSERFNHPRVSSLPQEFFLCLFCFIHVWESSFFFFFPFHGEQSDIYIQMWYCYRVRARIF